MNIYASQWSEKKKFSKLHYLDTRELLIVGQRNSFFNFCVSFLRARAATWLQFFITLGVVRKLRHRKPYNSGT
jgi:hypothetical protein